MFASAQWGVAGPGELRFDWDEQAGRAAFERAVAAIEAAESHSSGRLFGLVAPAEIDTCSAELLRASWDFAQETGRPYQVHTSESIPQFREITQRHGKTPVQWAHDLGILGPGASLGHGIFLDHHAKAHWHTREDLGILAETGTALAHCPTVFSRYGQTLESFGSYRRAGITIGLGTDTFPHNLIEEMRTAIIAGRITDGYAGSVALADAFAAATIGGAGLLLRDDIGRLAPGMKADLVSIDLEHALMRPVRDPLRSLVYTAAERAVRDVYVDGAQVVAEGRVLTLDMDGAAGRLEAEQAVMAAEVPKLDAAGRTAHEVSPLSLPLA
jgi:cytosine/adenosine deaminase-related metal-dependent hydrolase